MHSMHDFYFSTKIMDFWEILKILKIHDFHWFLVTFVEMYGTVRAGPTRTKACGASRTVPGCLEVVTGRVRMPWVA